MQKYTKFVLFCFLIANISSFLIEFYRPNRILTTFAEMLKIEFGNEKTYTFHRYLDSGGIVGFDGGLRPSEGEGGGADGKTDS